MKRLSIGLLTVVATLCMLAMGGFVLPTKDNVGRYPLASHALHNSPSTNRAPSITTQNEALIDAFVAIENESIIKILQTMGVHVNALFDGFITVQIPTTVLSDVIDLPGVIDVEIAQEMQLVTDSTLSVTHVNEVLDGTSIDLPYSYDGTGVIVGILDIGFDYQHLAFKSSDDNNHSRIVRVYDTSDESGHPAYQSYKQQIKLPGSVFMGEEINSLTTDNKNGTHGTHTASIAAGSHINGYGGMAPGADIVLCAVSTLGGGMSTVEIANCIRYIKSYADSVGKPCVISLSASTFNGQHDGNDYLSKAIKNITGPGCIFVMAAGNCGSSKSYSHKIASPDNPLNLLLQFKTNKADSTYFYSGPAYDIWVRRTSTNFYYKFHILEKKSGRIVWETDELSGNVKINASELAGYYDINESTGTSGHIRGEVNVSVDGKKYNLLVGIHNLICHEYTEVNGNRQSKYAIGVSIYPRRDINADIDAWICNNGGGFGSTIKPVITMSGEIVKNFYSAANDSCCIGTYAVGDSTISAGAFSARNSYYSLQSNRIVLDKTYTIGQIAWFSSFAIKGAGPLGTEFPTICAPGTDVVAACSHYSTYANNQYTVMNVDGNYWGVMSGTSMAAPTVAGIIALWLQANPHLSVADIKEILAQTAIRDNYTDGIEGFRFGPNGKIDALAGIRYVIHSMGFLPGDVDNDGKVSVSDITTLIDYLLCNGNSDLIAINVVNADLDGDGAISIADATELIDLMLTT